MLKKLRIIKLKNHRHSPARIEIVEIIAMSINPMALLAIYLRVIYLSRADKNLHRARLKQLPWDEEKKHNT